MKAYLSESEEIKMSVVKAYKKHRPAFEFFNCDEEKSANSMNPLYETRMYRDTKHSRRMLWLRIKEELENKRIEISEENYSKVREAIIEGAPSDASKYIRFGIILTKKMEDC